MTRPEAPSAAVQIMAVVLALAMIVSTAAIAQEVRPRFPGANDRCPVCGNGVSAWPNWLAQVQYADESTVFFDGPKDLFRYLRFRERYAREKSGVRMIAIFVTSFQDRRAVRLENAWFVVGSRITGPAGAELVPHATRDQAEAFIRAHGGDRILRAGEISPDLVASLH